MKICIDPGHSGCYEPGACVGNITEAAVNMEIGKAVGWALVLLGYEVMYTREGDIDNDDLGSRAQLANDQGADVFVSIHCNAAESTEAEGVEVYHYPGSREGLYLATDIQGTLALTIPLKNRGVKQADFAVLRLSDMPAVLVECGFLSSKEDREFLVNNQKQIAIALGIAAGINRYYFAKNTQNILCTMKEDDSTCEYGARQASL